MKCPKCGCQTKCRKCGAGARKPRAKFCPKTESGGARCEKSPGHKGECACPVALRNWLLMKYGGKIPMTEISP